MISLLSKIHVVEYCSSGLAFLTLCGREVLIKTSLTISAKQLECIRFNSAASHKYYFVIITRMLHHIFGWMFVLLSDFYSSKEVTIHR